MDSPGSAMTGVFKFPSTGPHANVIHVGGSWRGGGGADGVVFLDCHGLFVPSQSSRIKVFAYAHSFITWAPWLNHGVTDKRDRISKDSKLFAYKKLVSSRGVSGPTKIENFCGLC